MPEPNKYVILIAESLAYLFAYHCTKHPTHTRYEKKLVCNAESSDDGMRQIETHLLNVDNYDLKIPWFYTKNQYRTSKEILNMGIYGRVNAEICPPMIHH